MAASVQPISEHTPPASHRAACCVAAARGGEAGVHFSELRSEGADNARIRPLVGTLLPSMPSERGLNKPAASDLAAVPLLLTPSESCAFTSQPARAARC